MNTNTPIWSTALAISGCEEGIQGVAGTRGRIVGTP